MDESSGRLIVNKRELARQILECSLPTLDALIERFPDFPIERGGTHGVEYAFDAAAVTEFLQGKRDEDKRAAAQRKELFSQFSLPIDAIAGEEAAVLSPSQRAALAKARLVEHRLAVESGLLLHATDVRQVLRTAVSALGRFVDTLPGQLGRRHNLPDEVVRALRDQMDEARRLFVRDLRALLEGSGKGGEQDAA